MSKKTGDWLTPTQKAYTASVDDLHPFYRAMEALLGHKLKEEWAVELSKNPYVLARLARGRFGIAQTMLTGKNIGVDPQG